MSGRSYMHYSPSSASTGSLSPQITGLGRSPNALLEHDKYFTELLMEQESLRPFMMVLPHCSYLLNQEILRVSKLIGQSQLLDQDTLDMGSPLGLLPNGGNRDLNAWAMQQESLFQRSVLPLWHGSPVGSPGPIIKKTLRIEIPVDEYPNFNFVGRLLGPRGLSLKRVENETGCRVMIRGRGSIKDAAKMRDKPGYEHLNEPLHVLVEAELPANQIDAHLQYAQEIIEDVLRPPPVSLFFY